MRKLFEVEIPDGTHLDHSRDSDGAFRGTLRDDENNLVGHANLHEIDDYQYNQYDPYDQYNHGENSGVQTDDDDIGAALGLAALAAMALAASHGISRYKESRARRKAGQEVTAPPPPQLSIDAERALPPAGWLEDASGAVRWWDGQQWTEHRRGSGADEAGSRSDAAHPRLHHAGSGDVSRTRQQARPTMSSAEWQERARAMLLARAFSDEQRRLLTDVYIEDADVELLETQQELRRLTPEQFSERINAILEQHPQLRQVAALPPAGWYDDGSGSLRWWDSRQWTSHVQKHAIESGVPASACPSALPGWYDDGTGCQRWWNGQRWV